MPSKYESQDEKISKFIKNIVVPSITKKGERVDYNNLIDNISLEVEANKEKVEMVLQRFIDTGRLIRIHHIKAPDEQVDDYFKKMEKVEKETKEELKKIEGDLKNGRTKK